MNRVDCLDTLNLDNNPILDDQVDPIPNFNLLTLEHYGQSDLRGDFESALSQFVSETSLVGAFKQTRAEHSVDVHGRRNDGPGNLIYPNWLK